MHIFGIDNLEKSTLIVVVSRDPGFLPEYIHPSPYQQVIVVEVSTQGSYSSAKSETTIVLVKVTLFIRRPESSKVITGSTLDFLALQTFLFRLSSVNPG